MGYLKKITKYFAVPRSPIGWCPKGGGILENNRSYCKSNVPFNGEGLISLEKFLINYLRNISKYKFASLLNFGLFLPKSLGSRSLSMPRRGMPTGVQQDLNRSVGIVRGSSLGDYAPKETFHRLLAGPRILFLQVSWPTNPKIRSFRKGLPILRMLERVPRSLLIPPFPRGEGGFCCFSNCSLGKLLSPVGLLCSPRKVAFLIKEGLPWSLATRSHSSRVAINPGGGCFSNLLLKQVIPKGYLAEAGVSALLMLNCPPGNISDADVSNVGEKLRIQITPKSLIKNQRFFKTLREDRSLPDCLSKPPNQRSGHIEQTQLNLLKIAEATQISDWDPRSLIRAHVVSKEKKQKIQRLKRQRRQIGKKKKRKRISPRSLWLRFNLYDRFLKKTTQISDWVEQL
jgi:hypothetical protein